MKISHWDLNPIRTFNSLHAERRRQKPVRTVERGLPLRIE
jgi:hypothetical protein